MSGRRLPALDHGQPKRVLAAAGLSAAGEIAAIGLLATGAWLLFAASLRPPILLLSMAIGAVQLFSFLRGAARYGGKLASHDLGLSFQARSRAWLYRRLERLLPAGLPGGNQGDLLARLISDTEEAQDLVVRAAVPVLAAGAAWCAAVITAGLLLPSAGWVILISGVLGTAGVALAVIIGGRKSAALPAARGAVCAWILGAVASGEELSAMRAEDWALNRLAECERALGAGTRAVAAAAGMARAAAALAGGGGLAAVAYVGASAIRAGRIGPVEFGVLVFLALGAAAVLQGLPDAVSRLPAHRAGAERLSDLARMQDSVPETAGNRRPAGPGPLPASVRAGAAGRGGAGPAVALRRAAITGDSSRSGRSGSGGRPDAGQRLLISDLDLELRPGHPVALAGPSGTGKTTVLYALLRFVDLTAGELIVDGTDARAMPPEQIRALLAWSPEQPALFPASLRANLRVGAPAATDEQIAGLLADLRLGTWLEQLDRGLDTVLAPWAHPVSGGELQRLSVARALLADRPVLLLDEPTSHLDPPTADAVLAAVLERASNRSLLWVTHRQDELAQFPAVCSLPPGRGPCSGVLPDRLGRSVLHGYPRELYPGRNPQLAEDLPQMEGDRVHADVLSAGDFLIAQPARHQLADRSLGVGQARPADVRPPMSRPVPPPHPCLAQPPPDPG